MFYKATAFNMPLATWSVSTVERFSMMFQKSGFDQDIAAWNVSSVSVAHAGSLSSMFKDSSMSACNRFSAQLAWRKNMDADVYKATGFSASAVVGDQADTCSMANIPEHAACTSMGKANSFTTMDTMTAAGWSFSSPRSTMHTDPFLAATTAAASQKPVLAYVGIGSCMTATRGYLPNYVNSVSTFMTRPECENICLQDTNCIGLTSQEDVSKITRCWYFSTGDPPSGFSKTGSRGSVGELRIEASSGKRASYSSPLVCYKKPEPAPNCYGQTRGYCGFNDEGPGWIEYTVPPPHAGFAQIRFGNAGAGPVVLSVNGQVVAKAYHDDSAPQAAFFEIRPGDRLALSETNGAILLHDVAFICDLAAAKGSGACTKGCVAKQRRGMRWKTKNE